MAKSYAISQSQLLEIQAARKKNRNKNVERRLCVLVMRAEGRSLEEISEKTGYHISTASKLIARYMRVYIAAFAIGPGVCMWLVIPESLSSDVRATGLSVALLVDYAAVTAIITGFLPLTTAFGLSGGLRAFGVLLGDALFRVRIWVQGNQRQGTLMKTVLWA